MAATLKSVFVPYVQIGDIIKAFDFSSIDTTNANTEDGLTVGLGLALGGLTKETVKTLSDPCKIALAATLRLINKLPAGERNYATVLAKLTQNSLLEQASVGVVRSDKLSKKNVDDFNIIRASPNEPICKEAQGWLNRLIQDSDVLQSTNIDANVVAQVVVKTGQSIKTFKDLLMHSETAENTLIDICVLRLPDPIVPLFKLYSLKLVAWSQHKSVIGMTQDDSSGLTGVFNCSTFQPRLSIINEMSDAVKPKAIAEAEKIFD